MARTIAQIQAEMANLPTSFSVSSRGGGAQVGDKDWRKRQALQQELTALKRAEQVTPITAITTAMKETQRRAAEDKKLALAGVTGRETQATGAITAGREKGIAAYSPTEELLAEARKEVSPEREAEMYEAGRIGIEAGTQAGKRRLQETYARGGAPGGAMFRMMGDVESAGQGQLSEVQRNINIDRYKKLMGLTGESGRIAGAKATIFGQEGRSLADVYGTTGRTLADIYKHTIAKVPEYPEIPSGGGGTTRTVSGGGFRSAPKKKKVYRPTTATTWGSRWSMN